MTETIENLASLGEAASRPNHTQPIRVPNRGKKSSLVYNTYRPILIAAVIATLKTVVQAAQPTEIRVGDRAPLFTLKDQNEREFSLEAMLKKGPVAVVFVRSIEWCSYCQLQTVQLSQNLEKIQAAGGQIVMVSYDPPEK